MKIVSRYKSLASMLLMVIFALSSLATLANDYNIEHVKGDVYRFLDGRHRSVFLVTEQGILLTDPLNESAAK